MVTQAKMPLALIAVTQAGNGNGDTVYMPDCIEKDALFDGSSAPASACTYHTWPHGDHGQICLYHQFGSERAL